MAGKYMKKEAPLGWQKTIVLYLHDWLTLMVGISIVFLLLFRVIVVSGDSMFSTLWSGDYVLVMGNLLYREPEAGDIVVISKQAFENGSPIIKRVIATEGQQVDIDFDQGIVYVDGVALEEPYTYGPTTMQEGTQFPLTVAPGCIFVLGDNRGGSLDSRSPRIGQIDQREVLGKALLLMLPGDHDGTRPRDFGRIGVVG